MFATAMTTFRDEVGGYFFLIYNGSVFVALLISYLELFALPSRAKYASHVTLGAAADDQSVAPRSRPTSSHVNEEDGEANERTALLSAQDNASRSDRQTFARYNQRRPSQQDARHSQSSSPARDSCASGQACSRLHNHHYIAHVAALVVP